VKAVVDTNILVSGLLGLYTYPARIVDLIYISRLQCIFDDRIMQEYREVLSRPKFKNVIEDKETTELLNYIAYTGIHVLAGPLARFSNSAPDPNDLPFIETAAAGMADCIITGNKNHFSFFVYNPWNIQILSPNECYKLICQD